LSQWKNALAWLSNGGSRAGCRLREQKAGPLAPFVAFHGCGGANWTPRDYRALAREGYAKNAIVYRAVRMIAESAASTPIALLRDGRELADHPLLDLLKAPNGIEAGADLFEAWFGHLLLSGNAYLEAELSIQFSVDKS
jgi:phage portal protein BeeE